ncbi:MAG TPA: DUF92 domain-containing protein [Firmicutes bacterium]|nr:DUF92 domain-containing protein [Bacillota bacterium]
MISFVINLLLAFMVYVLKMLTLKGMILAALIGHLILWGGGFGMWCLLGVCFVCSYWATYYKGERKYHLYHVHEKGGTRDEVQVLANGFVPAVCCLIYGFVPKPVLLIVAAIGIASINADTCASELGVLSKTGPISILTFKKIPTGISGGITWLGTFSSFMGSFIIALCFMLWYRLFIDTHVAFMSHLVYITLFGVLGSIIDSLLGALVQVKYQCEVCGVLTEKQYHCERQTVKVGGFKEINNDWVNLISVAISSICGLIIYGFIFK